MTFAQCREHIIRARRGCACQGHDDDQTSDQTNPLHAIPYGNKFTSIRRLVPCNFHRRTLKRRFIMSPYRRNVMVGATVLLAMGVLGWMILQFGGHVITPFTVAKTRLTFTHDRSDGLSDGSPVVSR